MKTTIETVTLKYPCGHTAVVPARAIGWVFSQPTDDSKVQIIDPAVSFMCPHRHNGGEAPFMETGDWLELIVETAVSEEDDHETT